jgi:hypothetical protein
MLKTAYRRPVLERPIGITINGFRDDGQWGEYRAWFMLSACTGSREENARNVM